MKGWISLVAVLALGAGLVFGAKEFKRRSAIAVNYELLMPPCPKGFHPIEHTPLSFFAFESDDKLVSLRGAQSIMVSVNHDDNSTEDYAQRLERVKQDGINAAGRLGEVQGERRFIILKRVSNIRTMIDAVSSDGNDDFLITLTVRGDPKSSEKQVERYLDFFKQYVKDLKFKRFERVDQMMS